MIVKDGYRFIIPAWAIAALLLLLSVFVTSWLLIPLVVVGILALFITYFFRDPERTIPKDENLILSPGDGKVILIEDLTQDDGTKVRLVSVFLSIFDVHVNRIPITGKVCSVTHRPGRFFKAFMREAVTENERTEIEIESQFGILKFSQVAGILARRVVCDLKGGEAVMRGARFGLIRFGSRVDIFLPTDVELKVALGDHVKGGESIIGAYKVDG